VIFQWIEIDLSQIFCFNSFRSTGEKVVDANWFVMFRFEPDMLAFSGCYYGGGEKERNELGAMRKRWKTLHVSPLP
jgi:hypothetical protein